jgi:hypothetical protein
MLDIAGPTGGDPPGMGGKGRRTGSRVPAGGTGLRGWRVYGWRRAMILDERGEACMARRLLLRMDPRVLLTVGGGERGEASSEAECARNPAHPHDRGAADLGPARGAAPADLTRYTEGNQMAAETPGSTRRG